MAARSFYNLSCAPALCAIGHGSRLLGLQVGYHFGRRIIMNEESLDEVQRSAQEQFARQSHRYGKGHILENVDDVRAAVTHIPIPARAKVLDVATGGGHTGLLLAGLGHGVTLSDLTQAMLDRASA